MTRSNWIAAGIDARNCGKTALIRSMVAMTLALGCGLTITNTAGFPLALPALRRSCTESTTSPTSGKVTAAPLR